MKRFRRRPIKPKHVTKFANRMRHKLSQKEMMFLRRLTLANVASFDFQIRIGFYIADFVFPAKMLILELDAPNMTRSTMLSVIGSCRRQASSYGAFRIVKQRFGL